MYTNCSTLYYFTSVRFLIATLSLTFSPSTFVSAHQTWLALNYDSHSTFMWPISISTGLLLKNHASLNNLHDTSVQNDVLMVQSWLHGTSSIIMTTYSIERSHRFIVIVTFLSQKPPFDISTFESRSGFATMCLVPGVERRDVYIVNNFNTNWTLAWLKSLSLWVMSATLNCSTFYYFTYVGFFIAKGKSKSVRLLLLMFH